MLDLNRDKNEIQLLFISILLVLIILIADLMTPLGVAAGVPYALVVLLSARFESAKFPWFFAIIGTLLTLAGYIFSEEGGINWMVLANRLLAILAIWITAILGIKLKNQINLAKQHQGYLQNFVDNSPIMLWRADKQGFWIFCSDGWLNFTGRTRMQEYHQGWIDGLHPLDSGPVNLAYSQMIVTQRRFQLECRVLSGSGLYHWILLQGAPVFMEESGELSGFIGSILDIQDKKEAEINLESTRQKYYQREKMASIGIMASGVLHEVGNPLASIAGLMESIKHLNGAESVSIPDRDKIDQYLTLANHELDRLSKITADVGDFASIPVGDRQLLNLNDYIDRTYRLMKHDERVWNLEFDVKLDSSIPAVNIIADHFVQILQNLLSNAIDACENMPQSEGKIVISSYTESGKVCVEVKDNGVGMDNEVLIKAKQELYSTKQPGKGMGLGLSLCQSLVTENNGNMLIKSELGLGSRVIISFAES